MMRTTGMLILTLLLTILPTTVFSQVTDNDSVFADRLQQNAPTEADVSGGQIEQYRQRYIWFEDWVAVNANTGAYVNSWSVPYKGQFKEQLKGADFYEYAGRPDLAEQYRVNRRKKLKLGLIGAGLMITGGVLTLVGAAKTSDTSPEADEPWKWDYTDDCDGPSMSNQESEECEAAGMAEYEAAMDEFNARMDDWEEEQRKAKIVMITGGVISTAGVVFAMIGLMKKSHPIGASEARRIAEEYNQGLRRELGIPPHMEISAAQKSMANTAGAQLNISPILAGRTNGFILNVSF
ncbi:MAG: hypothetical protein JXR76_03260 [Deltaproteobacteria bacterium]|nr:hypothetical protein [Deltaproteobacteria bacterium]